MADNKLYYGDNLDVLRRYVKDESVDLVYLDPPFNSRQDYNLLFAEKDGTRAAAQIMAFEDTWEWNQESSRAYEEIVERGGPVAEVMIAFHTFLSNSDMMAYLAMMAPRLLELHRVLKETGSIYLHCDPTASHYLKLLMDAVFGPQLFRNEIIWKRTSAHSDARRRFGDQSDTILFYAKGDCAAFNRLYAPYSSSYIKSHYSSVDESGRRFTTRDLRSPGPRPNLTYDYKGYKPHRNGWSVSLELMQKLDAEGKLYFPPDREGRIRIKRYLDEMPGMPVGNLWEDIPPINSQAQERLGYPTQKPEALLERILTASSSEGDVVLDPFCGCGTAIAVAQKLKRRWLGIDITHLAVNLIKTRLRDRFGEEVRKSYDVIGEPVSPADASELAKQDPFQFQSWALGLVGARVATSARKGADRGIDGRLYFHDDKSGKSKQAIFSVKAGENVNVTHIRDLRGVLDREKAEIGVLISMEPPTKPMLKEAADAGFYKSPHLDEKFPRIQILTVEQLLGGEQMNYPRWVDATFKKAPKSREKAGETLSLPLGDDEIEEPF